MICIYTMIIWKTWKISASRQVYRLTSLTFAAFNLINNIDVTETEARIVKYRAVNAAITARNLQREEADAQALKEQEEMDRKERELRAAQFRKEEEEEFEEKEKGKREIIDKLETSQKDARKVVAKSKANALKRSSAKAAANGAVGMGLGSDYAKLLKTRSAKTTIPDEPHVPFQDNCYGYEDLFVLNPDGYNDVFSDAVRKDREGIMRAGGYRVEEAWERALRYAVSGLDLRPLSGLEVDAGGDVIMASA